MNNNNNNNNKILIEQRFTKALHTYKKNASMQIYMANELLKLIKKISNKEEFKDIFEFGCGCGLLTNEFLKKYDFSNYLANDIVEKCSDYILQMSKKKKINFLPMAVGLSPYAHLIKMIYISLLKK